MNWGGNDAAIILPDVDLDDDGKNGRPNNLVLTVSSRFNKHAIHYFHHTAAGSQGVDIGGIDSAFSHDPRSANST